MIATMDDVKSLVDYMHQQGVKRFRSDQFEIEILPRVNVDRRAKPATGKQNHPMTFSEAITADLIVPDAARDLLDIDGNP